MDIAIKALLLGMVFGGAGVTSAKYVQSAMAVDLHPAPAQSAMSQLHPAQLVTAAAPTVEAKPVHKQAIEPAPKPAPVMETKRRHDFGIPNDTLGDVTVCKRNCQKHKPFPTLAGLGPAVPSPADLLAERNFRPEKFSRDCYVSQINSDGTMWRTCSDGTQRNF